MAHVTLRIKVLRGPWKTRTWRIRIESDLIHMVVVREVG
jgi:hypothetical protein